MCREHSFCAKFLRIPRGITFNSEAHCRFVIVNWKINSVRLFQQRQSVATLRSPHLQIYLKCSLPGLFLVVHFFSCHCRYPLQSHVCLTVWWLWYKWCSLLYFYQWCYEVHTHSLSYSRRCLMSVYSIATLVSVLKLQSVQGDWCRTLTPDLDFLIRAKSKGWVSEFYDSDLWLNLWFICVRAPLDRLWGERVGIKR